MTANPYSVIFRHTIFGIAAFFSVLLALVPNLLWLFAWCVGLLVRRRHFA